MITYSHFLSQIKTKKEGTQTLIYCAVRKKWLLSIPEEIVRQAALLYLIDLGYPAKHITVERQIIINQMQKRYDIVVSNRNGAPIIVVECKAPQVPLDQTALDQAGIYNLHLASTCIWVTNGHENKVFSIDHQKKTFKEIHSIPLPA